MLGNALCCIKQLYIDEAAGRTYRCLLMPSQHPHVDSGPSSTSADDNDSESDATATMKSGRGMQRQRSSILRQRPAGVHLPPPPLPSPPPPRLLAQLLYWKPPWLATCCTAGHILPMQGLQLSAALPVHQGCMLLQHPGHQIRQTFTFFMQPQMYPCVCSCASSVITVVTQHQQANKLWQFLKQSMQAADLHLC